MKPILFSENAATFTTNGLGRLSDAISCVVTEERNGIYELEMQYPITGAHYSDIGIQSIIAVIPCDGGTMQAFRVYLISKPINGIVTINAGHISAQLSHIPAMPFSINASSSACSQTLAALKANATEDCPFTFWTDITTIAPYEQKQPASIRSRLGGIEGSVLDQFGGEYEWDNFNVKLHKQRGTLAVNNGITLRYGKNITDITQEENIAETVTGVVPFWSDMDGEEVVTLPEHAVYSQYAESYPFHRTEVLDLSGNWEEKPSENSLRLAAQAFVNKTGLGLPKVSIEVSFVALWQTEEYKDVAPLQRVKLCDEVTVDFEKLGISQTAKVVKTVYDVLAERYQSIQIGNLRSTLVTTLNNQNANTLQKIDTSMVRVGDAINKATAWLTGSNGYIVAVQNNDGSWKELLAMDTNDPDEAVKVLRMNENGIGGSSSGIDGPYLSALLTDGSVVATRINTGILSDLNNNFILDLDNGTLTIGGGAAIGDTNVSAMLTQITTTASGLSSEVIRATSAENALNSLYSGAYAPTTSNSPASSWSTTELKQKHLNDGFFNTLTGDTYMWKEAKGGVFITFDTQSNTESKSTDYVRIYYYDSSTGQYKYSNNYGGKNANNNISGLKLFVPTNDFYVYWKTDISVADWGFAITACEAGSYATSDIATLYPNSTSSLPTSYTIITGTSTKPESAHPYVNNTTNMWRWQTQVSVPSGDYNWVLQSDFTAVYSQIRQTADEISRKVSKGDVSSQLSVESDQITLASGRLIITAGNFQLDASGNMTCNNATISGNITLGGVNNINGILSLKNGSGTVISELSNDGFSSSYTYGGVTYKSNYGAHLTTITTGHGTFYAVNGIIFYENNTFKTYIGATHETHGGRFIISGNHSIGISGTGLYLSSEGYNNDLRISSDANVDIYVPSGYLDLTVNGIRLDDINYGYTGTKNGLTFKYGICLG